MRAAQRDELLGRERLEFLNREILEVLLLAGFLVNRKLGGFERGELLASPRRHRGPGQLGGQRGELHLRALVLRRHHRRLLLRALRRELLPGAVVVSFARPEVDAPVGAPGDDPAAGARGGSARDRRGARARVGSERRDVREEAHGRDAALVVGLDAEIFILGASLDGPPGDGNLHAALVAHGVQVPFIGGYDRREDTGGVRGGLETVRTAAYGAHPDVGPGDGFLNAADVLRVDASDWLPPVVSQLAVARAAARDELASVPGHRDGGDGRLVPGDDPLDDGRAAGSHGPPSNAAVARAGEDQVARLAGATRDAHDGVHAAESLGPVPVPLLLDVPRLGLHLGGLLRANGREFLRGHGGFPLRFELRRLRGAFHRLGVLVLVVHGGNPEAVLVLRRPAGRVRARDDVAAARVVHGEARLFASDIDFGSIRRDQNRSHRPALLRLLVRVRGHECHGR